MTEEQYEQYIQDTREAIRVQRECNEKNLPITNENNKIRARNSERIAKAAKQGLDANDLFLERTMPLSHKPPQHLQNILNNESLTIRLLKKRGGASWRNTIERIHDINIRKRAACIIYWDYFGRRLSADRWPHLDHLVKETSTHGVTPMELEKALYRCGYTPFMARKRAK